MTKLVADVTNLTYEGAAVALAAGVAKAREIGAPECIAVVDSASRLISYVKLDGAAVLAEQPAIAKARTAAALGIETGPLPFEFGVNLASASGNQIVNLKGGLPIVVNGKLVGAVGVGSGTPEQDVAVATAARDAVQNALK